MNQKTQISLCERLYKTNTELEAEEQVGEPEVQVHFFHDHHGDRPAHRGAEAGPENIQAPEAPQRQVASVSLFVDYLKSGFKI